MIAEKMKPYVKNNSAIRMMFEEGNRLRAIYGADKVYDFSLGNPSVPAPECVKEAIIDLVNEVEPTVLHGYMSNAGFEDVRQTIAESLNRRFGTKFAAKNLIMTVGAASGLNVIFDRYPNIVVNRRSVTASRVLRSDVRISSHHRLSISICLIHHLQRFIQPVILTASLAILL